MSKAEFHVFITRVKEPLAEPPSFGFQFDPETMECIRDIPVFDQGRARVVDLAVSPGIFKVGNSDGADYGSERVLVKLQALCNLQGKLRYLEGDRVMEEKHGDGKRRKIKDEDEYEASEVDFIRIRI